MDHTTLIIALACGAGLFMAWGIGANDVANAMGTSVGSRALTIKQAVIVAAVFEFAGAFLAGGEVTSTIRRGIVDVNAFGGDGTLLVHGMLAALLAAGTWLMIASAKGWPVSTTHTIVGAIVGFAAIGVGTDAVKWGSLANIVGSWVVSPLLAGIVSYFIFRSVQRLILQKRNPMEAAKQYVPYYAFVAAFVVASMTLFKGLQHIGLKLGFGAKVVIGLGFAAAVALVVAWVVRRIKVDHEADRDFHFASVERVFAVLMIVTACSMAFAHGSNDVANAIGPLASIIAVVQSGGVIAKTAAVAPWVLFLGAIGIVIGLLTYGARVIRTIGHNITDLTPSRGFAAELSAASTVVFASGAGLPISTTHTLVGAVVGVGFARGLAALDMRVVRGIFMSWVITLPAGAGLAVAFFFIIRNTLGGL